LMKRACRCGQKCSRVRVAGLDPVYVANEGKAVFLWRRGRRYRSGIAARASAGARGRAHRAGDGATQGMLVARTARIHRVIPTQIGEQLPRIC